MIKKLQFTLFILAITMAIIKAQNFTREFGVIARDEVELKKYAPDQNAEAVVLFDIAKSYFVESNNSFDVVFERATRIKILSEAGIKWAEVEIPFYQEGNIYEKVYDIEAASYNFEDGRLNKSQFDPANAFDEKINDYWNGKKFAIPNVKVGSVIEYRYKINSQYKFNFRNWAFQWRIPVVYSEYVTKMIPFYEYTFALQGAAKFDIFESYEDKDLPRHFGAGSAYGDNAYHDMVYKFVMKNVPAFGDEEFISSINDYTIKLDFQLSKIYNLNGTSVEIISRWEDLIKELLKNEDFGKYINKSERIASKLLDVKGLSQKSEKEKFNAVLDYMKNNFNWNNHNANFASKTPNQLVDEKSGNCADLNLLTIGLLNSLGIEAYPILLSTRDHGKIKLDYPFINFFNYVVVMAKVEGKTILADATEILGMNDRIPTRCINDKGLIIKKAKAEWIGLECMFSSSITTSILLDISANSISADLSKTGTEYEALTLRTKYTDKPENAKQKISGNSYSIIDSTIKIQNYTDKTKPYKLRYRFTTQPEVVNNKIYISPFLQEPITDNPLKQNERKYPVDMVYPQKKIFFSSLSIPDGYQAEFIPVDENIKNEIFELNYSVKSEGNKIQAVFSYDFKKPIYQSEEYSKVKSYFSEIVKKGNEKIVLIKKNGGSN
jgi:transglutaminase-like putative cysteine protease